MARLALTPKQATEFAASDPMLVEILSYLADVWPTRTALVTSLYRDESEDASLGGSGIHASWPPRACDVRTRNLGQNQVALAGEIVQRINARWVYDPSRPRLRVAIAHTGTAYHIHLQVHPRTTLRAGRTDLVT